MATVTKIFASRTVRQHGNDHAGVFTWEIDNDLFYADAAIAKLFQIDPHEAERGLPLIRYLGRIHPDDRPRAAKSIHDTILSGGPCQQDYRVLQKGGPEITVMAFGRCFKGRNGGFTHYSGIIHEAPAVFESPRSMLRSQCASAHADAISQNELRAARHLSDALAALETTDVHSASR